MQPVYLFTLASQHERWATVRQAVLTRNIANANTAGYVSQDIQPFSAVLDDTAQVTLAQTEPGHLSASGDSQDPALRDWQPKETGQPVALDQQLMQSDETNRAFSLDVGIVREFHKMLLTAVRSA